MKARVKTTGEIVNVTQIGTKCYLYDLNNVEILDEPDYWEKLKHQAAISAMQGLLAAYGVSEMEMCIENGVEQSIMIATALVNRLKEDKL